MRRLVLCLPLCLLLNSCSSSTSEEVSIEALPLAKVKDDGRALPKEEAMVTLARTDPVAFLENCVRRYKREVKGYRCLLVKQERRKGKLLPTEEVICDFREEPFSVRMDWRKGAGEAARVLYVKGENNDKLVIVGSGWRSLAGTITRDPAGADVRESTRYLPTEFGVQMGSLRTLASWQAAKKRGDLQVHYLGEKKIKEVGDRVCWVLKRDGYKGPEDGGVLESTFYVDKETWQQVGSVLKGKEGKLIGSYYFRDVQLNPKFDADTFSRERLKKKG